jgi:hypothetical protein
VKFFEPFVMCENFSSLIGIFDKNLLKGFLISNSIVDVFRFDNQHNPCIFSLRRKLLKISFLQRYKLWSFGKLTDALYVSSNQTLKFLQL